VQCGPELQTRLVALAARPGLNTGLVVGAAVQERFYPVFLAETPREEAGEDGEQQQPSAIDVGWMLEHAKQVSRLLPGGLAVLGCFIFHNEDIFLRAEGKIRKIMGGIASLDDPATDDKLLFLNHNIGKVFEVKSTSFKNIDVKTSEKAAEFVRLDTSVVLDLPVALQRDDGELAQEVVPAVDTMEKNLQDCLFIFSNKLLPDSQVIGKPVETDNKRIKGKSKTEVLDTSLEVEEQEVITTDLLFTDTQCPAEAQTRETAARLKVAGRLCCRCYLPPGATVRQGKAAVRADLLRSLRTRLAMHCDTSEPEQEPGRVVHEPPRRVFVAAVEAGGQVAVSDYLYPGEGMEDCVSNMKEIFGWEITEDAIEDDVEIVASPREVRPPASPAEAARQKRRARVPLAVIVSGGMAVLSVGLAWLALAE